MKWSGLVIALLMSLADTEQSIAFAGETFSADHRDYVVLLHGLGRSTWSMKKLEWALRRKNYRVINVAYPSTRVSIEDAANVWLDRALKEDAPDKSVKIHFVAHSMGGIVLRQYLSNHRIENLGRVVMLAPPNQGSELAERLKNNCFYRIATGPSGQELGTGSASLPKRLGAVEFPLGVIAGDRSLNPVFSAWIPGPDDGKVSVRSTRVQGMRDFLLVHKSHTWMMWSGRVILDVASFLRNGLFRGN